MAQNNNSSNLSELVDKFLDNITLNENKLNSNSDDDIDLKAKGKRNQQKHQNTRETLDSWFQNLTHPFTMFVILLFFLVVQRIVYFYGKAQNSEIAKELASDIWVFLTYLFTIVMTSIFTSFIDQYQKK